MCIISSQNFPLKAFTWVQEIFLPRIFSARQVRVIPICAGATAASPAEQAERSLKMSAAEATAKARRMEENMEALATQAGRVIGDIDSTIDLNLETASKRAGKPQHVLSFLRIRDQAKQILQPL